MSEAPADNEPAVTAEPTDTAEPKETAAQPREPDRSKAELDVGWGERPREPDRLSEDDERLLRERPPHWE